MTKMSNLPTELAEEVLCRIPMTSLRRVRSTCKKWNTLSKDRSFAKQYLGRQAKLAAAAKEFTMVLIMEFKVYLISVNLHNTLESCIKREGKLISLDDSDEVDVSEVFHCEGLLLCIMKDNAKLVVWNPYCGLTRRIKPAYKFSIIYKLYWHALGYDKSSNSRSHKILVFTDFGSSPTNSRCVEFKLYDFNSDSWRVLDLTPDWRIATYRRGISLKGDTYWFATGRARGDNDSFLLCFDFTRERFGPRLPLPVEWSHHPHDTVTLSSVREEQLAILFQAWDSLNMEIWITTKIEPNEVSWNSKVFLAVAMRPITCSHFQFLNCVATFLVDEEKKVAVVFDKEKDVKNPTPNVAYIVGVDGSLKEVYLGESASTDLSYFPRVCSYVPSLLHP